MTFLVVDDINTNAHSGFSGFVKYYKTLSLSLNVVRAGRLVDGLPRAFRLLARSVNVLGHA